MPKFLFLITLSIVYVTANQKWIALDSTNNSSFAMSKPYSYNKKRTTRSYKTKRSKGIRLIDNTLLKSIRTVQDTVRLIPYKRNQ
ncbi:MAG: hypothetical protein HRT43_10345 [Campylobacteraceae bacterium]|nr:hypothetical protein [Campylobacteraceae bacterium]